MAEGEFNLLGNCPEMDQARHLPGVRARLVAGAGNEPAAVARSATASTTDFSTLLGICIPP